MCIRDRLVREVVERYDIDGVHFDYLRYPENAPLFPDKYDFRRYSKGRTLDQWRRAVSYTHLVRVCYVFICRTAPPGYIISVRNSKRTASLLRSRTIRCSRSTLLSAVSYTHLDVYKRQG